MSDLPASAFETLNAISNSCCYHKRYADNSQGDRIGLDLATSALQACERLHRHLRQQHSQGISTFSSVSFDKVYEDSSEILNKMRCLRSSIEGTSQNLSAPDIDQIKLKAVWELKRMHIPESLTPDLHHTLQENVSAAFCGSCKKILFAALVNCPWFQSVRDDRGQKAIHNNVIVIYQHTDDQYFAPTSIQEKNKTQVIEQEWFFAMEAQHFCNHLVKGKARYIELFFVPESAIFIQDNHWRSLREQLPVKSILGLRGFGQQCINQAVGAVAKHRNNNWRLRNDVSLYNICESFRLLHHVSCIEAGTPLCMTEVEKNLPSDFAEKAHKSLVEAYTQDHEPVNKEFLLQFLISWHAELEQQMKSVSWTPPNEIEKIMGQWLSQLRRDNCIIPQPLSIKQEAVDKVTSLMEQIGGPFAKMDPQNILMITRAGSYLYGLNTPQSDVDYVIIYADPIEKILGSCRKIEESYENRGPEKQFEYGAYEARLFCEMLWKGSVVILELIFAEDLFYTSDVWQILVENKHLFLTEHAILQYFGLIRNNMAMIESGKHKDSGRERKLFYQIFHKLYCLEFFLRGEAPTVKCTGPDRQFIMGIRTGKLEGDMSRDYLYEKAKTKVEDLREALANRRDRLPENVNFQFLMNWIKTVRGWPT